MGGIEGEKCPGDIENFTDGPSMESLALNFRPLGLSFCPCTDRVRGGKILDLSFYFYAVFCDLREIICYRYSAHKEGQILIVYLTTHLF